MSIQDRERTELDASSLECPLPLLKTKLALKSLDPGCYLQVKTTDSASLVDIPKFIAHSCHNLVSVEQLDDYALITIEKG